MAKKVLRLAELAGAINGGLFGGVFIASYELSIIFIPVGCFILLTSIILGYFFFRADG